MRALPHLSSGNSTHEEGGGIMMEVLFALGVNIVGSAVGGVIAYYVIKRWDVSGRSSTRAL